MSIRCRPRRECRADTAGRRSAMRSGRAWRAQRSARRADAAGSRRPRRRDLRIGFGRRVERNAHGVIEPFTHGGAAGHTEQPEIILSRHRNRPPLTAGAAARAHFTCKFRHIIRHKVRCFHRHQRTIGGFIPYSNQEPGVLGFPIYGLLCNPCYDDLYHPKLNRQNDMLSKKTPFYCRGAHFRASAFPMRLPRKPHHASRLLRPAQSAVIIQEIPARDIGDGFLAVSAAAQFIQNLRHIGRALAIRRRGFDAVKIAAEADVLSAPSWHI